MKHRKILYCLIWAHLLFVCFPLSAEEISEEEYARLASKFLKWENSKKNDSQTFLPMKDARQSQIIASFTQQHEYAIPRDYNNQTYISKILIIVKDNVYCAIPSYIIRYAHDIHNSYGCIVDIVSVNGETAPQIRSVIQSYSANLNGVVLIGDIAPALYNQAAASTWNADQFPCDLFYMDLNGTWHLKAGSTDEYDDHTGNVKPEVFVGRINTANMGRSEIQELKWFFDKDHRYWIGQKSLNKQRALTFTETDWNHSTFWNSVAPLYGNNYYDVVKADMFYKSDYLNYLQNSSYEFIQLACHSWSYAHDFEIGGSHTTVSNYEITSLNRKQIGYNLFCCHACNWDIDPNNQCLGEAYLYGSNNNSAALVVVGSTKTGSMLGFSSFYSPLGSGKCVGYALKQWWLDHCGPTHTAEEKRWFYGMTILGDPLVNFNFTNECDENLLINYGEEEKDHMYYAQNRIDVHDYYLTQGQLVTLSASTTKITGPFKCKNSTFKIQSNDKCICNTGGSKRILKKASAEPPTIISNNTSTKLTLYPNPTSDVLNIQYGEEIVESLIYNIEGDLMMRSNEPSINVSQLPYGIYVVHVLTANGQCLQNKFIKR